MKKLQQKHLKQGIASFVAGMILAATPSYAADSLPTIQVQGSAPAQLNSVTITPADQDYIPVDTADMVKSVPGANVNKNGPMTGISQYRGMFGSRMNVQLDGLNITPAGPNWMDPPLSHIAPSQLENIQVIRGISPVSAGAESIGGTIKAKTAQLPYSTDGNIRQHGTISGGYDSNNNAFTSAARLGISSGTDRLQINGNYDKGQDMKAGNGKDIVPTQYKRHNLGVEYSHLFSGSEGSLGYHNERVDNAGSPALPMDIIYVKGNTYSAAFHSNNDAGLRWLADIHYINTDHLMNNFSLRSAPLMLGKPGTPVMRRASLSNAKDFAYKLHASLPLGDGRITVGTDGWLAKNKADVTDPNNAAFSLQNYNNAKRNRFSLFSEWQAPMTSSLNIQTGVRYSRVNMNSGTVSSSGFRGPLLAKINTLSSQFNTSQRKQNDNLLDLSLQLTQTINDNLKFNIGVARKQRAPSYQERYLWSPLESTAGLADKRTYVGDVNLNPETAYHIDAGLDWQSERTYFTPHIFYKRVNNYIQGTSVSSGSAYNFRVLQGNMIKGGSFCTTHPLDPFCVPLKFTNVNAELYGADAGFGVNVTEHISLDGTISYVRGKRRDIKDNLYRIAPLNSTVDLSYFADSGWSLTTEGVFYDRQNQVSQTNAEQKTAGYSIFNLHGRYSISRNIELTAGVNNVLDRFYQNHLSGYNRISTNTAGKTSAVATGARLPGEGRNFFIQAQSSF